MPSDHGLQMMERFAQWITAALAFGGALLRRGSDTVRSPSFEPPALTGRRAPKQK
jgi:hypothetical protein